MRRVPVLVVLLVLAVLGALPAAAAPGGAPGSPIAPDSIWADGALYATIGRGSLPYNGVDASFDHLYMIPGQAPLSEAAPGNRDYNGGRWLPTPVTWTVEPYVIISLAELMAAEAAGDVVVGVPDHGAIFLCPLIPNH